jgi:hypothetical protein
MAYNSDEARQDMLDDLATATDDLAVSLANLGAAYEQLDDATGDRLEEGLFRPVQHAYGRARRTHAEFAARMRLPGREFQTANPGVPSHGVRGLIELAVEAAGDADDRLAELQDSMKPVEVGDPELRAGLAQVRELLGVVDEHAAAFVRTYGR